MESKKPSQPSHPMSSTSGSKTKPKQSQGNSEQQSLVAQMMSHGRPKESAAAAAREQMKKKYGSNWRSLIR